MPSIKSIAIGNSLHFIDSSGEYNFGVSDIPNNILNMQDLEDYLNNEWIPSKIPKSPIYKIVFVPATQDELYQYGTDEYIELNEVFGNYKNILDENGEEIIIGYQPDYQMVVHIFTFSPLSLTAYTADLGDNIPNNWWLE